MENELENTEPKNKLDVYLEHMNPNIRRQLTKKQSEKMERYTKIFAWRCKLFSPEQTRKLIMQEWGVNYSWAAELYADMEYIFGNDKEINKTLEKRVLLEYYHQALSLAVKGKDSDPVKAAQTISNIADKIGKLMGLGNDVEEIPRELLDGAVTMVFHRGKKAERKERLDIPFTESEVVE